MPSVSAVAKQPLYTPIPRVSCAHPEDFVSKIVSQRSPVIVTDLISQWPACRKWTPDYFRENHRDVRCLVVVNMPREGVSYEHEASKFLKDMSLPEFIDYMEQASSPCYYRRQQAQNTPGLEADLDFARLTPGETAVNNFLWIGSAGTRTGLHFDMQDNVLCQIYGSKDIVLIDPRASSCLYPYPDSITKSRVTPDRPDLKRFPKFADVTALRGTLGPGEMIFIPNRWWHSVVSLSPSISVNHEFGAKTSWSEIASAINAGGIGHWLNVTKDFLWYGVLGRSFRRRLADDPPFGRLIYDVLKVAVARRLASNR